MGRVPTVHKGLTAIFSEVLPACNLCIWKVEVKGQKFKVILWLPRETEAET